MANGEWRMVNGEWRMANGEFPLIIATFVFGLWTKNIDCENIHEH